MSSVKGAAIDVIDAFGRAAERSNIHSRCPVHAGPAHLKKPGQELLPHRAHDALRHAPLAQVGRGRVKHGRDAGDARLVRAVLQRPAKALRRGAA